MDKLEGNIASLNEQLNAARAESKALKAEGKAAAGLQAALNKEKARAEVHVPQVQGVMSVRA